MPTEVFNFILESTLKTLREHYSHVESPIEAPGKTTYGDIDVLVTGARVPEYDPASTPWNKVAEGLAGVLGAVASIRHSGQSIVNLAIPWPERPLGTGMQMRNIDADSNEVEEPSEDKYIQIDIHHLHSPERFQWELFHSSHGDMWNILGSTIRRFGKIKSPFISRLGASIPESLHSKNFTAHDASHYPGVTQENKSLLLL